jgi:two-component system sensor histidine kinase BaeS
MKGFDLGRLRWRLLIGNLLVAGAGAFVVAVAVSLAAPQAFDNAMGNGTMVGMGGMMSATVSTAFGAAVGSALLLGLVAAGIVAVVVALVISARLARPISALAEASGRIAAGHYDQRVQGGGGELGQLASSFNALAASLEATERRRLELIGDIAHELRTPIASLSGYLEGLEDDIFKPGPDTWRVLGDSTARLARLVDDLSDLWRAEAHEIALVPEDLDGPTVLADAVERHRGAAAGRSIELGVADAVPVRLRADRARLTQVLDNLVGNALRYTPEGGAVRLALASHDRIATITVSDTGPGLSPDQLGRVFERFYRADPSRSREAGGSGLGLAIAKALTEAMGGRIWATSAGLGHGATFGLELPRAS